MILSHKHRFIFLKTRKTAGTSVELALSQLCGPDDILTPISQKDEEKRAALPGPGAQNWQKGIRINRLERFVGKLIHQRARGRGFFNHVQAREVKRIAGADIWNSYFKFSVERNPWDRQVSLYYWRYRNPKKRPTFDAFIKNAYWRKKVDNYDIYSLNGEIAADFVIQYDRLDQGFDEALNRIGITDRPEIPTSKSGTRTGGRDYRDHYTDETRDMVGAWYAREIEAFGYRF